MLQSTLFLFAATAVALNITQPRSGSTLDTSNRITIAWTTSSSDPPFINLALEGGSATGVGQIIATNVSTSAKQHVVPANTLNITMSGPDAEWMINVNTPGSEGNAFVGQSGTFKLVNGSSAATSTASASASSSNAADSGQVGVFGMLAAYAGAALPLIMV